MQIKLKVFRFDSDKDKRPYYDEFKVPYSEGMTLLDGLNYIQQNLDKTLSFRWECRSGICGTCGYMLNRQPVLGCTFKLDSKVKKLVVEPLANFPVEKDLVVDLKQMLERLKRIKPYLVSKGGKVITRDAAEKSKPFRKCIECGCCIAASKTVKKNSDGALDPMALVKLARFLTDPRDMLDRRKIARQEKIKKYSVKEGRALTKVCPRAVPIDQAIKMLQGVK